MQRIEVTMPLTPRKQETLIRALQAYVRTLNVDYDIASNEDLRLGNIEERANCGVMLDWLVTH